MRGKERGREIFYLPSVPSIQNHPPSRSYSSKSGQSMQLHPLSSISSFGFSDAPLAQNRAPGSTSCRLFGLKLGQGPQFSLQMFRFLSLSGTF